MVGLGQLLCSAKVHGRQTACWLPGLGGCAEMDAGDRRARMGRQRGVVAAAPAVGGGPQWQRRARPGAGRDSSQLQVETSPICRSAEGMGSRHV